ncbi:MAG: spermidine synthase [Stackebrandtia sp.]
MFYPPDPDAAPRIVARVADGPHGELVLRRVGDDYEIVSNGVFLMDTRNGESERLLVSAACERLGAGAEILIGGLGVGFSLAEALSRADVSAVTVVEMLRPVVDWHAGPLRRFSGGLDDPRVEIACADLRGWLRRDQRTFDAICLDVDNGPGWTVVPENAELYGDSGLELVASRLRSGGVLSVWSAAADTAFAARLRRHFVDVAEHEVPVPRGDPDVVFTATRP